MGQQVVMVLAYLDNQAVAGALYFRSSDTLYGRYWGCEREFDCLHFEACYYQGIEYCIANRLECFEPGTQGEHKIARGFVPTETWSAHWLSHPRFNAAIDDYIDRETGYIDEYMDTVNQHVPYRQTSD